jgi:hypothetical protein
MAKHRKDRSTPKPGIGQQATANDLWQGLMSLPFVELCIFVGRVFDVFFRSRVQARLDANLTFLRERLPLVLEDRDKASVEKVKQLFQDIRLQQDQLRAQALEGRHWKALLEKRTRKSAPATIIRNAELCRLRQENPDHWTLENLRRRFGLGTVRAVTKILSQEEKWRQLVAELEIPGTD